jgi:hypothetical protein
VSVSTSQGVDKVILRLALTGSGCVEEDTTSLEWAGCQSIAGRIGGKAYQKRRKEGGVDLVVEFAPATKPRL